MHGRSSFSGGKPSFSSQTASKRMLTFNMRPVVGQGDAFESAALQTDFSDPIRPASIQYRPRLSPAAFRRAAGLDGTGVRLSLKQRNPATRQFQVAEL